jgi:preprotein translocase subunit SecG
MSEILLMIQVGLTVLIIIFVMLQKSSSVGLGAYSGSNESMFGAKGPTSFLAKATLTLGLLFVINTLTLGYLYNQQSTKSILDNKTIKTDTKKDTKVPSIPKIPNKQ